MPYNFNPFTGNFDSTIEPDLSPYLPLSGGTLTGNLSAPVISAQNVFAYTPFVFTDFINYTISKSDLNKFIGINNDSESFLTIPNDSSENLPDGFQTNVARLGTGSVELSAENGVNLRSAEGRVFLRVRNSTAAVIKLSANDWIAFGDIFDESL